MDAMIATMIRGAAVGCAAFWLAGCVMSEKYDAEKARALNFQRLLAQEEKRTGDLDSELKRAKREAADHEAKTRELGAQLQAVREQLVKAQEEIDTLHETAASRKDDRRRPVAKNPARAPTPKPVPPVEEPLPGELEPAPPPATPAGAPSSANALAPEPGAEPRYHAVKPGENLFRIGRKYGVSVDKLKQWNGLPDNDIEIGQKLIIGYE